MLGATKINSCVVCVRVHYAHARKLRGGHLYNIWVKVRLIGFSTSLFLVRGEKLDQKQVMAESSYSPSESPPPQSSNTTEARLNRDSIKKGFNDLRKFADTNFTRAKQVR